MCSFIHNRRPTRLTHVMCTVWVRVLCVLAPLLPLVFFRFPPGFGTPPQVMKRLMDAAGHGHVMVSDKKTRDISVTQEGGWEVPEGAASRTGNGGSRLGGRGEVLISGSGG